MTLSVSQANMANVTEEKLHQVVRAWLRDHVNAAGGQRKLGVKTGIKHPQISNALDEEGNGQVSWRMLALISEMPGMSMSRVFDQLAGRCAAIEGSASPGKRVASGPVQASTAADEAAEAAEEIEVLRGSAGRAGKHAPKAPHSPRK